MFPKKSVILFAAGWMLLALVALPAHASAASSQLNPSTVIIDTFPIFEDQINVQQAHITWRAAKEDVGMQATIAYIALVNDSTTTLLAIHENFRQSQARVGMADSSEALDTTLQDFRRITQAFNDETAVQLKTSTGNAGDLRISMQSSLAGSDHMRSLEVQYWQTRTTIELADFDLWTVRAGEMLTTLRGNGYEITAAHEKLTEITTMRNELATTISTRDNTGIEQAHKKIHTASIGFAQTVRGLRVDVFPDLRQKIEQGSAVMTRARMVNADLNMRGLMNGSAESYVSAGTAQLSVATVQLDNGNT
ncbi:MAG: hypothetical protein WC620_06240 [Methanoregula sp.]